MQTGDQVCMDCTCYQMKVNELWEIKKYKGPDTCMNPVMNMHHRWLDVLYISTLIRALDWTVYLNCNNAGCCCANNEHTRALTGKCGCPNKARWPTCSVIGWLHTACCPCTWRHSAERILALVVYRFEDGPFSNTNQFQQVFCLFNPPSKASRVVVL